jgi:hypothetical protein
MTIKDEQLLSLMRQIVDSGYGSASPDDITLAWLKIMRKFTPLIGANSVLLIFERSVDTHQAEFVWLPAFALPMQPNYAVEQLRNSMANRTADDIVAAHRAIMTTFIDLITTLIGTRLAIQFLRAAFSADEASSTPEEKPNDRQTRSDTADHGRAGT